MYTVGHLYHLANVFAPLAVCREQFKYLSYKGLAL